MKMELLQKNNTADSSGDITSSEFRQFAKTHLKRQKEIRDNLIVNGVELMGKDEMAQGLLDALNKK